VRADGFWTWFDDWVEFCGALVDSIDFTGSGVIIEDKGEVGSTVFV